MDENRGVGGGKGKGSGVQVREGMDGWSRNVLRAKYISDVSRVFVDIA